YLDILPLACATQTNAYLPPAGLGAPALPHRDAERLALTAALALQSLGTPPFQRSRGRRPECRAAARRPLAASLPPGHRPTASDRPRGGYGTGSPTPPAIRSPRRTPPAGALATSSVSRV